MPVTTLTRFELGGVRYHLLGAPEWRLSFKDSPCAARFGGTNLEIDHEVAVTLTAGALPLPGDANQIFDTGAGWRLRKGTDHYVVAIRAEGREPVDTLVFDREVTRGTLACVPTPDGVVPNPFCHPIDQILSMFALASRHGIILHATGAVREGRVCAFAARDGGGKSTLASLIDGQNGWRVIADDRLIIRWLNGTWLAHGTPWPGTSAMSRAEAAPLEVVYVLRWGADHQAVVLDKADALRALLPVTSVPWFDAEVFPGVLDTVAHIATDIPTSNLFFRPDAGVLEAIRRGPQPGPTSTGPA